MAPSIRRMRHRIPHHARVESIALLGIVLSGALIRVDGATVPLNSNFEGPFRSLAPSGGKAKVQGELPPEWEDNSNWADVDVTYARLGGGGTDGGAALEMRVGRVSSGRVQLISRAVHPAPGSVITIHLAVASPDHVPVEILLRQAGPPYTTWWRRVVWTGPSWRTVNFQFPVRFNDPDPYFMIAVERPGVVRLDNVRVELSDLKSWLEPLLRTGPNLLPSGRFPLGLTNAWTLSHVGRSMNSAGPDYDRTAPSGAPPLKVTTRCERAVLYSPLFAVLPEKEYVVSFDICSEDPHTPFEAAALPGKARKSVVVERRWQRVSLRFRPPLSSGGIVQLRFTSPGTFWLDGVQVEPGQIASPFHSETPELHLAPKDFMGLTVLDDDADAASPPPVRLLATACGDFPADAVLHLNETDAFGRVRRFAPIPAAKLAGRVIEIPIVADPAHPMGSWRITGKLTTDDGAPLGAVSEVVVHRIHRPMRFRKPAPESFFGVHISPSERQCRMAALLGFKWVRVHDAASWLTKWCWIEPRKGEWIWHDDEIDRYRRWGFSVLGMLGTAPPWASVRPEKGGAAGYWLGYYAPRDLSEWERYVTEVVRHYRRAIRHWEVWNEPWAAGFFRAGEKDGKPIPGGPDRYMALLRAAYRAAHKVDDDITILGPCTAPASWSEACLKSGLLDVIDAFSYHQYTPTLLGRPGDEKELELDRAVRIQKKYGNPKPVWNTEGGPGRNLLHFYDQNLVPLPASEDAATIAAKVVRYCLAEMAAGTAHLFLYTMHGWNGFAGENWSLLSADGGVHPLGAAVSQLAYRTEGARFVQRSEVQPGLYACAFRRGARRSVLAAYTANHGVRRLLIWPRGSAYDMMGNELTPPIDVGIYPVYLTYRGRPEEALAILAQPEVWK